MNKKEWIRDAIVSGVCIKTLDRYKNMADHIEKMDPDYFDKTK